MNDTANCLFQITNPFLNKYKEKINIILFAHHLIGTVRGKSANGLMIHSQIFNVVAIIDSNAIGKKTSEICLGVKIDVPIYKNLSDALLMHQVKALIFLIQPTNQWYPDIEFALKSGLDIINTSFLFLRQSEKIRKLAQDLGCDLFDLRDVTKLQAYPNTEILKRKTKVVYITGTDCGLGKRTAAFELTKEARKVGINAAMYATGQTGLMLGERGTVVDALISEFSNGIVSQQVCQFSELGYELIFVEGQSDIFHPANSAVALSILHGANPDCIIIVHDEDRKIHKGFEENSSLYQMYPLDHYIKTLEMLSLPCGPVYKTIGIATIGQENINKIKNIIGSEIIVIADVLLSGGAGELLNAVIKHTNLKE